MSNEVSRVVIVDVVRTASGRGKPGGALSTTHPAVLLADSLAAVVSRTGIDPSEIDDVIAGCVGQGLEQSMNIARTALLTAGFPLEVPGTTVDRQCGSSQQALHFAAQGIASGAYDVAIACGVESMSRVPMGAQLQGAEPLAPLAARFPHLPPQGIGAELVTARWGFSRQQLDEFAARSHELAAATSTAGGFTNEIVPFTTAEGLVHSVDETIRPGTAPAGLAGLRAAFTDEYWASIYPEITWAITAGNSSPLTDGASAALLMSEQKAASLGLTPRARYVAGALAGADPEIMLTAPIPATHKVLAKAGLTIADLAAYEVNEAFAPVPLAWAADTGADLAKLNPRGGAMALGHPLGASGTRILATLLNHLEQTGGRYGLQTVCEAGGLANATVIECL